MLDAYRMAFAAVRKGDWNDSAQPGEVGDALNQLARRQIVGMTPTRTVTDDYTATDADRVILASSPTAGLTVTLPSAVSSAGVTYVVKKVDSTAGVVTVNGGGENIDGAGTTTLTTQYDSVTVVSDGSQWWIVGSS